MEFEDMAQSQALACQHSVSEFTPYVELRQSLPSTRDAISPFLDQVMHFIKSFRNGDGSLVDIEIAVNEALTNSMVHGNHEDSNKRVFVTCRCSEDGEVSIAIRDEGAGFDTSRLPDPTAPENVLSNHGRGIYLIRTLMDEVTFEQNGTVLKMSKRLHAQMNAERTPD